MPLCLCRNSHETSDGKNATPLRNTRILSGVLDVFVLRITRIFVFLCHLGPQSRDLDSRIVRIRILRILYLPSLHETAQEQRGLVRTNPSTAGVST